MHGLEVDCMIHGSQDAEERNMYIEEFQKDREHVILCQIQTGGTGISLHDTRGKRPRVSLICPPVEASVLVQALGRIYRAGTKTPARQRLVYLAGVSFEERLIRAMRERIHHLSTICDEDLRIPELESR